MTYLEILIDLRKIIRSINLESKKIEKDFGISIQQLLCLQFLQNQPDYQSNAAAIKAYLQLNASTVSGILARLENKTLVVRLPKASDKRVTKLTLTAKGAELLRNIPPTLEEKLSLKIQQLSTEKRLMLKNNLALLVALLDAEQIEPLDEGSFI
ncbi:MAG: MarR family transcriptional regulator [Chitinophagales bacterium]|nr:MarR family transcriptional regulator [Bacteroidota bacterium]MCB9043945.1 MarR family transcriptional regulator [Chitinophagales bacterium]